MASDGTKEPTRLYIACVRWSHTEKCTRNGFTAVLLDWEKAFDKIGHQRLFQAMERMGVEPH